MSVEDVTLLIGFGIREDVDDGFEEAGRTRVISTDLLRLFLDGVIDLTRVLCDGVFEIVTTALLLIGVCLFFVSSLSTIFSKDGGFCEEQKKMFCVLLNTEIN